MVTELIKENEGSTAVLQKVHREQASTGSGWLDRLRANAMERFSELGFPSVKNEEWKYTNVAPVAKLDFGHASVKPTTEPRDLSTLKIDEARGSELVFVNGNLRTDLSSMGALSEGIIIQGLTEAIAGKHGALVNEHLGRSADYVANGFTALNTAFISDGAFVYIPKDISVKTPIHLLFVSDGLQTASYPRVLVVAAENSSATLVESHASDTESEYLNNSVVEVVLKDGARLEHFRIQRESLQAFHVGTTVADLGANAKYDTTALNFGAKLSRHDISVTMDSPGAECWVDGLYLLADGQHTDTHSLIDHRKPHCSSHQLYKGILDGKSRAVFNGKVFVRHDAQKTDAMQTNKNLLLSPEARVDTKPQLEILADDVKCAHGAAVGQIDEEELFYLETRGIHPDLGRNLLTYGFAEEVIDKIKIESIKQRLDEAVLNRLNAKLEV
jgi:Fe-S cluster assembly protein SufD